MQIRRLRGSDDTAAFSCGDAGLDRFLSSHAWRNQDALGIGVTYVAPAGERIAAFMTLAAGSVARDHVRESERATLPRYPLPVVRLARLGVDSRAQGEGLGGALVDFALHVAWAMRERVGCIGVAVDALPEAVAYYERLGFESIAVLEGSSALRPRPVPMHLWLNDTRGLLDGA